MFTGRCDCGKVEFEVETVRDTVTVCHCKQCRRTSGHIWASTTATSLEMLKFKCKEGLTWYNSSDFAKRGFCKFCGSSLFYQLNDKEKIGIAAGCLEGPTDLKVGKHIFTKFKGDYYDIHDDVPCLATY